MHGKAPMQPTLRITPSKTTLGTGLDGAVQGGSSAPAETVPIGEQDDWIMVDSPKLPHGKPFVSVGDTSPRLSTLRRKTDELFSSSRYSSSLFEPEEDELDQPSPDRTMRGNPSISVPGTHPTPLGDQQASVKPPLARASLALNHLAVPSNTPVDSSRPSTLRRKSADLFKEDEFASSNPWDPDESEFVAKLESMRLNPTQRIRGNPLRSLRTSPSSSKWTPSTRFGLENKENSPTGYFDQHLSASERTPYVLLPPTGNSPMRSTRRSPLRDAFVSSGGSFRQQSGFVTDDDGINKGSTSPVKSIWDADEEEFDRWPEQEDLEVAVKNFTIQRGTYHGAARSASGTHTSVARYVIGPDDEDNENEPLPPIRGADLTQQEHEDFMLELADMNYGNPNGLDAHDEVMQQFYQPDCNALPVSNPAGYPHLIAHTAYLKDEDRLVQLALPRLCDAVATVLYLTSPKCLTDFLDPNTKVFEWRRDGNCLLIRREGNQIIVGTYHNYGTCYVWTYFVRSSISSTGAWKETYAGASQITTPVSANGVEFEDFVAEENEYGVDPTDEKYALYIGRLLGRFLLESGVWDVRGWRRWNVVWEADGVVTDAREYAYEELRAGREDVE